MLRTIHSQDLTIDGVDRHKRRTQQLSSLWGGEEGKHVTTVRKLLALKRTLKVLALITIVVPLTPTLFATDVIM